MTGATITTNLLPAFVYNPDLDPHRHNPAMHYRIVRTPNGRGFAVACVQDFDYFDYADGQFVDYVAYDSEDDALDALPAALQRATVAAILLALI